MIYIRVLNLPALREIIIADSGKGGQLSHLIDGQRTPILYRGPKATAVESITLMASIPKPVREAMDQMDWLFEEYTHNELFDHQEQLVEDGVKVFVIDDNGGKTPAMIEVPRSTDIFDLFHDTTPYEVTDDDGTRMVTPPTVPLRIA